MLSLVQYNFKFVVTVDSLWMILVWLVKLKNGVLKGVAGICGPRVMEKDLSSFILNSA